MKTNFEIWRDSDNVIKTAENGYKTQCGQYKKEHTEEELKAYFIKEYCSNDKDRADEIADLLEHYEDLPEEVQKLIDENTEFQSYEDCEEFKNKLHKIGYTCEYGLDNIPHSLIKLETTNETPEDMNTTEKNNKLIAEFMEAKQYDKEDNYIYFDETNNMFSNDTISIKNLKFHSDWNWLIPVIEKCRESQIFGSERLINNIYRRLLKLDLLATYENVVDFIQWNNQQKN